MPTCKFKQILGLDYLNDVFYCVDYFPRLFLNMLLFHVGFESYYILLNYGCSMYNLLYIFTYYSSDLILVNN